MPTPTVPANLPLAPAADDACYLALKARDARFDGHFFTGVTSTGIYCRPVCRVRTPQRANCRFFALAAQAEAAGFRPCLRCRPELAPQALGPSTQAGTQPWSTQDASQILARQAAQLLDNPEPWSEGPPSIAALARRLGVSTRHVRRIFETHWGVSPLQYVQTRRLLAAKQLLTDTHLPVAQVALLSGYASVRRFNTAFAEHYRMEPRALRKSANAHTTAPATADPTHAALRLTAAYRPPYDVDALLAFFAARQIPGVEHVDGAQRSLARTLNLNVGNTTLNGWVQVQFVEPQHQVVMHISASLAGALPLVLARVRALLDLDADPQAIQECLGADFPGSEGLRVPGCLDGFELAVRAVLGQQITVRAACTLAARLVQRYGTPITTPLPALNRLFPTPRALSHATPDDLGALGIVRQRKGAIVALAQAVHSGSLHLYPGAPLLETMAALQALPGIGPWTAHYIAMRALRWPDAFPSGDVALHKALGVQDCAHPQQAAEAASQRWRPWRSYAVLRAWARLLPENPTTPLPTALLKT